NAATSNVASTSPATPSSPTTHVAGPDQPAPASPSPGLPTPTGRSAAPLPAYPDRRPAGPHAPRWNSGVRIDELTSDAVKRAARLARSRGRAFDVVSARLPAASWRDVQNPGRSLGVLRQLPGRKVVSVSLLPDTTGELTACSKGDYRAYWGRFARAVRANDLATAIIDLRPDAQGRAQADPAGHSSCYRRVVGTLRQTLPGIRTQWSTERGASWGSDALRAWPGAAYVDILGLDSIDTGDDWGRSVNGPFGLTWWSDFAAGQRRPLALARWGAFPGSAESAANTPYVQNMHDWMVRTAGRKRLAYETFVLPRDAGQAVATYRTLFAP
ncbi:MAG: hypothetical protein Q4P32_08450, partial [Micrococcales bacterium]|nr:hypothetical protein [Micrococcales bacterium]